MIKGFVFACLFSLTGFAANAAVVPYGQYRDISGSAIWDLKGTVVEYYANIAPSADAPKVGDTGTKHVQSNFTGYIDNTLLNTGYTDYHYDFENGWYAYSDGQNSVEESTICGYTINFCVGQLGGADYKIARSLVTFYFDIAEELGIAANGAPVLVSFSENVIIENRNNSDDFHYFTVNGTQTFAKGFTVVPLPASGVLLAFALLPLVSRRKNAKMRFK